LARAFEWVYIGYFSYVFLLSLVLKPSIAPRTAFIAVTITLAIFNFAGLSREKPSFAIARDWLPLAYTLVAYREMDLFSNPVRDRHLELAWIAWDRVILSGWGLRAAIESLGALLPAYLEFCYLLVYGTGAFAIAALYLLKHRDRVDHFLLYYALGTLLSYAMFPFFPSDPPRVVFPGADLPAVTSAFRGFNLFLVGNYGIHSSVFPSAHVSSAFGAAWGLLRMMPERRRAGIAMLVYATSVSIATVYGRYHYAADAIAGIAVGSLTLLIPFRAQHKADR
jgi:membrane-associated phospholipid phosphatase